MDLVAGHEKAVVPEQNMTAFLELQTCADAVMMNVMSNLQLKQGCTAVLRRRSKEVDERHMHRQSRRWT